MARKEIRKDCPSCGLKLPIDAKVCEFCGWDFGEEDEWVSQIEELEKEIDKKKPKARKNESIDAMIESTIHSTTLEELEKDLEELEKQEEENGAEAPPPEPPEVSDADRLEKELLELEREVEAEEEARRVEAPEPEEARVRIEEELPPLEKMEEAAQELRAEEPVAPKRKRGKPEVEMAETLPPSEEIEELAEELPAEELAPAVTEPEEPKAAPRCPICGNEIDVEKKYCSQCGADFEEDESWITEIEEIEKQLEPETPALEEGTGETLEPIVEIAAPKVEEPEAFLEEPTMESEPAVTEAAEQPEEGEAVEEPAEDVVAPQEAAPEEGVQEAEVAEPAVERTITRRVAAGPKQGRVNGTRAGWVNGTKTGRINGTRHGKVNGTKAGRINGTKGRINGTRQGKVNGTKGRINGTKGRINGTKGRINGTRQGKVNGTKAGRINGTKGRINGTRMGRVNGTDIGKVNGLKGPSGFGEAEEPQGSRLHALVGGRFQIWQLLVVAVVAVLIISSVLVTMVIPGVEGGIKIDGEFSDWGTVPAYSFTQVMPGDLPGIDTGKIYYKQDATTISSVYLYIGFQPTMFTSTSESTAYVFLDTDSNAATGYRTSDSLGADMMVAMTGWNGTLNDFTLMSYMSTHDDSDWNSWQTTAGASRAMNGNELEIAVSVGPVAPLAQISTFSGGKEYDGPTMSIDGTIVAKQEPLVGGSIVSSPSQPVTRISLIAMGVPDQDIVVTPALINAEGVSTSLTDISVSTEIWTTTDLAADLSSLSQGEDFSYTFYGSSTAFKGKIEVTGESSCGYYMSVPTGIEVDGMFADWNGRKVTDTDPSAIQNPNIDIKEYGAVTQNGSHFMYVGTVGKTFDGADVPEARKKSVPSGGGGGSVVRLRKTGEDLLQAFIDIDPASTNGKYISANNATIWADYLVELFGRDGTVTETWVMQWSASNMKWIEVGDVNRTGVGANGVEFSVNKSLLGNLTASNLIFFTTDWKAESDNAWLNGALADPWAVRGTSDNAQAFRSNDGIDWGNAGTISLASGETVVALANSIDRAYVFAVTNTGKVYDWHVNVDTEWGSEVTGPCNSTSVVGIAPNTVSGEGGCIILGSNGWTWSNDALGSSRGWTNGTGKVADGATDFRDISFNATGSRYWAMRSGANTPAYWAGSELSWTATNPTGSSAIQTHIYNIGDDGENPSSEQVLILCESGAVMYSADGGANWEARGDLPVPGENGLPLESRYVAIDRDGNGAFWAITNTSYCYRSYNVGVNWSYTGAIGVNDIVSLACPLPMIPEFESLMIPAFGAVIIAIVLINARRRRTEESLEAEENQNEYIGKE
jgi:hypothetical protein